jgi:hypothetical protein
MSDHDDNDREDDRSRGRSAGERRRSPNDDSSSRCKFTNIYILKYS